MKRGQVAIFIIIAIIIIFSIISYFIILDLSNKKSGEESKYLSESLDVSAKDIENQISDFIEENVYSCVKKISKQGGYLTIPVEVYVKQTSYWYYEGKNLKPTLKFIEGEINNCILNQLKNSTNQLFGRYGNKTISIDIQGIKSSTRITEQGIFTEVDYPIYIYKETSSLKINSFKFTYQTNFNKLYNFAAEIVNFAATPEFDKCNPFKEFSDEEINFSFFTEGDNLFIKGQIFLITQDKTKIPYELIFAIKRPIKEAFGENKKRLAVLYQEDKDWPTFGDKAIQILKNDLEIQEGADYFDCKQVGDFISRIEDYDVVIITGNLQFQIAKKTFLLGGSKEEVSFSDSGDSEGWTLIYGCDAFNRGARKITIKNWVNQGGFLWINDIAEYETDDFFRSYIGSLGYHGGELKLLGTDLRKSSLQE